LNFENREQSLLSNSEKSSKLCKDPKTHTHTHTHTEGDQYDYLVGLCRCIEDRVKVILCPSDVYKVRLVTYGRMRNKMPTCLVAKCWPFFMPGIKTFGTFSSKNSTYITHIKSLG